MKSWIALVPVFALILGGATGCERKDYKSQEYSRADQGTNAQTDTGTPSAGMANPAPGRANEPAMGMRPSTPAERNAVMPNTPGAGGGQEEASAGMQGGAGEQRRILTGKLNVQDEDARTFVIEGNAQTYVAPQQVDLVTLDGKQVSVRLDENGRVQTIDIVTSDRES